MGLRDLFRGKDVTTDVGDHGALVARYKRRRVASRKLNDRLVGRLTKETLFEGGRKLGMLEGETLAFNTEDESAVLMDYCIYDVRPNGRNAVEQYLIDKAPDSESEEMTCLRAMQDARYSLFAVESVEPGVGISARDLRTQETVFIVDLGFAKTAFPRTVFASRLLPFEDVYMSGGAALPLGELTPERLAAFEKKLPRMVPASGNGDFDPANVIRTCLSQGASSRIRYEDPRDGTNRRTQAPTPVESEPLGRNSPCPCGSGKKFKQCCMRR
jgi:hypothetical protein